jgi:endonuclease YncB( thermonuclease family)
VVSGSVVGEDDGSDDLEVWEELHNPDFDPVEFDGIRRRAGLNSFTLTPKQWISGDLIRVCPHRREMLSFTDQMGGVDSDLMKVTATTVGYAELLADIGRIYENAQQVLVEAYWKIGQRVVEIEQGGATRAQYGDGLLARLSKDLSARYGEGFSLANLKRIRSFYLTHRKGSAPSQLAWTQYVEILPVDDARARKQLERRAAAEGLSSRELRKLVRERGNPSPPKAKAPPLRLRRPARLEFLTYRMAPAVGGKLPSGHILVDCGFDVYRSVPAKSPKLKLTKTLAYTYAATVERVVDGDTVWAFIDVGFGTVVRKKLRLHGVNAPELSTTKGEEARDYISGFLPPGAVVVIRSYASDAFGRYLADILCPRQPATTRSQKTLDEMVATGLFLNQDMLTKGLVTRVKLT